MADLCFPVSGIGPIVGEPRFLDCNTDSVTICVDGPLEINGNISGEFKHPGVPGTIVTGSRWHSTGFQSLGGTLTITSPVPAGNQRVVCDWLDYSIVIAVLSLLAGSVNPQIHDGIGGATIWQNAIGLLGSIGVGTTYSHAEQLVLVGGVGNQLEYSTPATLNILDKSINFGGYIVEV